MTSHASNPSPLIDAGALAARLASGVPTVLLDASFDLADAGVGERTYREAHVPGAQYVHLDRDLADPTPPADGRFRGRHPLPAREAFAATAGRFGVRPGVGVVVYDRQGSPYAARAWWMLRWLGHPDVTVLDGGLAAWVAAGQPVTTTVTAPDPAEPYPIADEREPLVRTVDADTLQAALGRMKLIDARAPERFRGDVEPLDPVAGHIPGALNRFFKDNLDPQGRFRPAEDLRAAFVTLLGDPPAGDAVHQCGSGVTACHNLLAMEAAGLPGAALYPGSWSEWCADERRPIARG